MPTVYVVQDSPGKNLLPAASFGELCVLLSASDLRKGPAHMGGVLTRKLRKIQPQDYVLLIGDPIAIGLTMHVALTLTFGIVNVLRWDRRTYKYNEVTAEIVL